MTNTLLNPQTIAKRALARLHNEAVLSHLVSRDYEADFAGAKGKTVQIRKPSSFTADEFDRANGLVIQDINETYVDVTLDTILDVTVGVTDEELSLDIDSFDERVLSGMIDAIVQGIEEKVAAMVADVAQSVEGDVNDPKVLAKAMAVLSGKNVPLANRYAVAGPDVHAEWVTKPPFDKADSAGSDSALRDARLGKAYSFETFMANTDLGDAAGVAFHKSGLALVTRTLALPPGATGYVESGEGFGIRVIQGYNADKKMSTVSVDLMIGTKVIDADRAVVLPAAEPTEG